MAFSAAHSPLAQTHPGVSRANLIVDAPELLPLLSSCPGILIYTRLSPHFSTIWLGPNCRASSPPRAIVCPASTHEVAQVLLLASELRAHLPLAIRGGGHDSYGRSTIADGLVLDTRALDTIELSADKTQVRVGAGVLLGPLLAFLEPHDVFVPMGYCSTVGFVGWSLGGGFGVYTAGYGAGAENIVGVRIVTADGRVLDSDIDDEPELFWALRGVGNGNFGVVVELRARVHRQPRVLAGYIGFPNSEAAEVLGEFSEKMEENMPDEFNGDVIFANLPGLGPVVSFMFVWTPKDGDLRPGHDYLSRIRGLGTVILDTVEETTPCGFLATLNSTFKDFEGAPFCVNNPTISRTSRAFGQIVAANPVPSGGHVVGGTHNVHGVVERPNSSVALPNRRHVTVTLFGAAEPDADPNGPEMKVIKDWVNKFTAEVKAAGIALEAGYVSFDRSNINLDRFYGPKDSERLRELKRKYDPEGLFVLAYPTIDI